MSSVNGEAGPQGFLTRFGSTQSLFRSDTQQSLRSNKKDDAREVSRAPSAAELGVGRLRAISRVTWGSVARGLRQPPKDQTAIKSQFQQKLRFNSDTVVAGLELAIVLLSCIQLELSSRSPRWRENRVCETTPGCMHFHDEGSFAVPNAVRIGIAGLALVRVWVRGRFLLNNKVLTNKSMAIRMCGLEVLGLAIFPYPGLEYFIKRNQTDVLLLLSAAVGVRTICWRQLLYFPYPIRQKEKVASFSGNLEFSYRAFVFKKVMDDNPLKKLLLMCFILLTLTTFFVRASDTINADCAIVDTVGDGSGGTIHAFVCSSFSWSDAMWLVITSFMMLGYGDVLPRSNATRGVIVFSACIVRCLIAMLVSIVIKKANFSTMEARVHAYLFRMDLFNKKDLSAVLAVQSSFRFNKSYKQSLMWHRHNTSLLYYRPLSARLPNEVKKKLYGARFQASLKDILKFNTDGDLINSFAKHIEVITAALGVSLVEMAHLKKVFFRRSRVLEERKRLVMAAATAAGGAVTNHTETIPKVFTEPVADEGQLQSTTSGSCSPPGSVHQLLTMPLASPDTSFSVGLSGDNMPTPLDEWGYSMVHKCEQVLAQLQRIEQSAQRFRDQDRSSSFNRSQPQ